MLFLGEMIHGDYVEFVRESSLETVTQYRAAGFDFIAIGSDIALMVQAAQASMVALRGQRGDHVHTLSGGTDASA